MVIHNSYGIYRSSSTKWSDSHTNKAKDLSLTRERHNKSKTINTETMETVMTTPVVVTDMKRKVQDILMSVSWRDFANTYFQKSSSWFYHKMDGIDGNGGAGGFNQQETEQMRGALIDLSNRIRRAAENI